MSESAEPRQGVDGMELLVCDDDVAAGEFADAVVGVVHVSTLLISFRTACTLKTHNLCIHSSDLLWLVKIVILKQCNIVPLNFTPYRLDFNPTRSSMKKIRKHEQQ